MNRVTKDAINYDLTCWYLNKRRVIELVGAGAILPALSGGPRLPDDQLRRNSELSILKEALRGWLAAAKPPTLGELIVSDRLRENSIFSCYTNFFFKGLLSLHPSRSRTPDPLAMATASAKLDDLRPGLKLSLRFHPDHLTSNSAWGELTGQKRLLVVGAVTGIDGDKIDAIPYVIANPLPHLETKGTLIADHWITRLEVFVDGIDNFARVTKIRRPSAVGDLSTLRNIPEADIKAAFAHILGEPNVPKDWGGERSDLFSDRVEVRGERVSTAFVFKGPAKFEPLTLAGLGKNGDQIDRLFTEPAGLLVLQHCHTISPPVRGAMRAYAQRLGDPRLFCLIDGYDTIRVLRAYGQCSFTSPKQRAKAG